MTGLFRGDNRLPGPGDLWELLDPGVRVLGGEEDSGQNGGHHAGVIAFHLAAASRHSNRRTASTTSACSASERSL